MIGYRYFNGYMSNFYLGIKRIDQCWDSKYNDHHFGIENFRSIHLCNMLKKQQDGYYEIYHEQHLCKTIQFICILVINL